MYTLLFAANAAISQVKVWMSEMDKTAVTDMLKGNLLPAETYKGRSYV